MKKILALFSVLVAGGLMLAWGWPVAAQGTGSRVLPDPLTLEGVGSGIGVSVRDLTAQESERAEGGGVLLEDVLEGTPAARAGFKDGDIVVEFDGERVRSARQFTRLVRETRPGRAVRAVVLRGSARETVSVTPEARTASDIVPGIAREVERGLQRFRDDFDFDFDQRFEIRTRGRLGATLSTLTPQLAEYFGVKEGLLVSAVADGSSAAEAGLRAGDVIVAVGGTNVRTAADVTRALRAAQPGATTEMRVMRERKELTLTVRAPETRAPQPVRRRGRSV